MKRILLLGVALLALAGLAAAVSAQPALRPALQPTATPVVEATSVPAESAADDAALADEAPAELPAAVAIPASNCVTCHANQEQLMALAEAPVETVSLNEGSG